MWAGQLMDYGTNAEMMANTRKPYESDGGPVARPPAVPTVPQAAFVQISDDVEVDDDDDTLIDKTTPETLEQDGSVPLNFSFL
jgi:hypothetical protein